MLDKREQSSLREGKPWLQSVSAVQRAAAEAYSGFRGAFWGPKSGLYCGVLLGLRAMLWSSCVMSM